MSQQEQNPKFRRQSKIDTELGIALSDEGLRLTVFSPRLTKLSQLLLAKGNHEIESGRNISNDFNKVLKSLKFTNEFYYVDSNGNISERDYSQYKKVNKLITTKKIPNLKFLVTSDQIAELIIDDPFCDEEIQEWITLFQKFVGLMKKVNKEYGLLN